MKIVTILLLPGLILLAQVQSGSCSEYTIDGQRLTPQENWVLEQVSQGKEADLEKRDENPKRYLLRARFLEKLLIGELDHFRIPRQGVQIANAVIEQSVDLKNADVDHFVRLSRCVFKQPLNFQDSHFKKSLDLSDCLFGGQADFEGMKIDNDGFFSGSVFEDEVVWTAVTVGGKFYVEGAEFRHPEKEAIFNGMKVNYSIFIKGSKFYGPVNFVVACMGRHLQADGAQFLSPVKVADFKSIKVGMSAFFRAATFHGPVNFQAADINEYFMANGAKFLGKQPAVFSKLRVGQKAFFDIADRKNQKPLLICCGLDISYGNFYDLEIRGIPPEENNGEESIDIPSLILKGSTVQRDLIIDHAKIGELDASHLQVKGPAKFRHIEIGTSANFRNSAFQGLSFDQVKWPAIDQKKQVRPVYLNDLTYNSISIDKQPDVDYSDQDFQKIKSLVEASPFNTQSYVQMETFFKSIGRESWAKEVFIRMNNRELAEKMPWWDVRRWLEWFFWGQIAGYGRAPFRVFFLSLALIILGAFLFDPEHLTANKRPPEGRIYKSMIMRFFLSLDRFLPIELGLANHWESKERSFFVWFYFYLQQVLGWILIPIALASIYSQLK